MNASAPAREPATLDPAHTLSDEIAQTHPPANGYERMLATAVALAWERLERAHEVERQYFKGRDMAEIIRPKLDEFKAVTRYVTDCERAWRHALANLEKTQRRRQRETKASLNVRRTASSPAPNPSPRLAAPPAAGIQPSMRE